MKKVRKKAFWGALASVIGGAMQIGANAIASKANREAENERFERELKAREDLIEKNRFYNLMQNEITQQMNSNQNQSIIFHFTPLPNYITVYKTFFRSILLRRYSSCRSGVCRATNSAAQKDLWDSCQETE